MPSRKVVEGLRCQVCRHEFDPRSTLEVMRDHFEVLHPEHVDDDGKSKVELETLWDAETGEQAHSPTTFEHDAFAPGPNRTQRRYQAKRRRRK